MYFPEITAITLAYLADPIPWGIAIALYFLLKRQIMVYAVCSITAVILIGAALSVSENNHVPSYFVPIKLMSATIITSTIMLLGHLFRGDAPISYPSPARVPQYELLDVQNHIPMLSLELEACGFYSVSPDKLAKDAIENLIAVDKFGKQNGAPIPSSELTVPRAMSFIAANLLKETRQNPTEENTRALKNITRALPKLLAQKKAYFTEHDYDAISQVHNVISSLEIKNKKIEATQDRGKKYTSDKIIAKRNPNSSESLSTAVEKKSEPRSVRNRYALPTATEQANMSTFANWRIDFINAAKGENPIIILGNGQTLFDQIDDSVLGLHKIYKSDVEPIQAGKKWAKEFNWAKLISHNQVENTFMDYESWYKIFIDSAIEINPSLSLENGKNVSDFLDHEPLIRAHRDEIDPTVLGEQWARKFNWTETLSKLTRGN
jgi:hypothetical protein